MKVIGFRHIYSGSRDPEMELNTETSKKIYDMLCEAYEPSDIGPRSNLGPSGYSVYWSWNDEPPYKYPAVHVYVYRGLISISCFAAQTNLKDTIGLEKFLEDLLKPLEGIMPGSVLKQK